MADALPIRHRHGLRPVEDEMLRKHVGSDDDDNKGDAPKRNQVTSLFSSHGGGSSNSKISHGGAGSGSTSSSSSGNLNGSSVSSKSTVSSSANDSQGKHRRSPLTIIWASPALLFVFLAVILMNAGLAVTVPSLALQLDSMAASPELLGYIAAAAPLVSVFSPTITGLAADKFGGESSYTCAFAVTLIAFALGNLAQAFARGPLTLCLARVLVGCSTGATTIAISHIIRELQDKDERVRVVAVFSGSEMLGYIAGTAIGGMLSTVRGKLLGIRVNGYNAPTLVSAAAALLLLLLGLPGFRRREAQIHHDRRSGRHHNRDEVESASACDSDSESGGIGGTGAGHSAAAAGSVVRRGPQSTSNGGSRRDDNFSNDLSDQQKGSAGGDSHSIVRSSTEAPRRASRALFTMGLLVALYCMVAAMYNALETVATPLTLSHFGWGVRENALMWTLSGVVGTIASLGVGHLPPGLAAPSDLLAISLAAAAAGPWLMRAGLKQAAVAGQASGIASAQALSAAATAAHAAAFSGATTHHSGRHRGAAAAAAHAGFLGGGSLHHPLFWVGFLLFDMGYVVSESMITVLYASAVEVAHGVGGDEDGGSIEIDEHEGEGAFAFGIFNSVGWFLGCALGAVAGNELYLKSTSHMLIGCSCTAIAVGASLVACRRAVFSPSEAGWLLRRVEPGKWLASSDSLPSSQGNSSSHHDTGVSSSAGDEAVATYKSKNSASGQSPATFQRRGSAGREDPDAISV